MTRLPNPLLLLSILRFVVRTNASDRLVEFSSRTLPRVDQLDITSATPLTLTEPNAQSESSTWALDLSDNALRPTCNTQLCLSAEQALVSSPVYLTTCSVQKSGWVWDNQTEQMRLDDDTDLCLTSSPIGITHTVSLAYCSGSDRAVDGTYWDFVGTPSVLVSTSTGMALHPDSVHPGVRSILDRLIPVFATAGPEDAQVLMGCFGWMIDLAIKFTGLGEQQLPIINPESPQWSTGNATYSDLLNLLTEFRTGAAARGLHRLRFGILFVGWGELYNLRSNFSVEHPEIYAGTPSSLSHGNAWHLHADRYPYASSPNGVVKGSSFFELFGAQWGILSKYLRLDAVILRDGLSGYAHHGRHGPFGDAASNNATENQLWINGVRELFMRTKTAAPHTMVIGYSQEASAIGGWRVGLSDVETLVADGFIDAWVDQSWAGAWEDVPTRASKTTGWSFHLMYILIHRAMIEGGNRLRSANAGRCKHYVLHGLFDAYEGFDTIHKVPLKLQWGVWAYSLAALVRPGALATMRFADGHYVSWANSYSYVTGSLVNPLDNDNYLDRPTGLLTSTDIVWLSSILDSADAAVRAVSHVSGPTVLYDRSALAAVLAESPADNVNEWVDEQLGVLVKYGVPIMKVGLIEDGINTSLHHDGLILSIPSNVSDEFITNLSALAATGAPILILGRCDKVSERLLSLAGARCVLNEALQPPYYGAALFRPTGITENVSIGPYKRVKSWKNTSSSAVMAEMMNGNVLMTRQGNVAYAQLNDYRSPVSSNLALSNYGSAMPHYVLATELSWAPFVRVGGVTFTRPITLHTWQLKSGGVGLLVGNLDGNFCGGLPCSVPTELTGRSITLSLHTRSQSSDWRVYSLDFGVSQQTVGAVQGCVNVTIDLPRSASRIYFLVPIDRSTSKTDYRDL